MSHIYGRSPFDGLDAVHDIIASKGKAIKD